MVRVIRSEADCHVLADLLLGSDRETPIAVVSTRQSSDVPFIDTEELEDRIGHLADVYLVITGSPTYALADRVGDRATVYGGASRVYPPGTAWVADPYRSPLRFCYSPADARRALEALVADAEHLANVGVRDSISPAPQTSSPFARFADQLRAAVAEAGSENATSASPDEEATTDPLVRIARAARRSRAARAIAHDETRRSSPEQRGALRDALARIDSLRGQLLRERAEWGDRLAKALDHGALEIAQLESELQLARARARDARARTRPEAETEHWLPDAFADARDAVREAVRRQWVESTAPYEKVSRELPEFDVGDAFAESFAGVDRSLRAKTLRCIVDVLTAPQADRARGAHLMSVSGVAGGPPRIRDDGAKLWRASVETNAPAARRLHYWRLPGGRVELSRVVVHDDYQP